MELGSLSRQDCYFFYHPQKKKNIRAEISAFIQDDGLIPNHTCDKWAAGVSLAGVLPGGAGAHHVGRDDPVRVAPAVAVGEDLDPDLLQHVGLVSARVQGSPARHDSCEE